MAPSPTALVLNCTLKPSPEPSSTDLLAQQFLDALSDHGVSGEAVRVVDHSVAPGVETDMGDGDDWPALHDQVLAADILVVTTPIWLGHPSSVAQRVLERLDAMISEERDDGNPVAFGRVALVGVVGNEDGAHKVTSDLYQGLNDIGFTIAAQGGTYWVGEAMQGTDYRDLDETPDPTATALRTAVANAVHLSGLLREQPYPAS
ncbi:hypothetical protein HMPREF0063_10128 [Aeromicrobium marinum DSM 15272]|uniref:NADPH-dependent FMN reductase-like domain-containing protein n=1 Tax=Aeromicrobium marinum DSM 15272 TaxID=585531 RepID=E2S7X1_9ACTN|nr:NAD(P)H-dependent oxidoreductase [Aeromicrobium marinum]EFQ84787.1 hypothetical protein HMPREF0063_10128 [Aeromicrobium marinum DSM 15272]